jgi:uncharacterized protein YgiM (DUF1202 family)
MNMRSYSDLTRLITLTLLLGLACSCAKTPVVKPPEGPFFVTPEITYLLDSPGYGGNVLGPLYRGDKVEIVDAGESAWWRVELQRSGQTGWVRKELLSPNPVATVFYFVKEDTMPLRECPRSDCMPLQLLFRGDQVQRVEEGVQGWWRVLVINSRSLGWVPAAALTERREDVQQKQLRKSYYYVAVRKLILRAKPSNHSEVVRTLGVNDQVEKIGETEGWFNVRQPSSGAVGWVISRYLDTLPLISPRGVPSKKKPGPSQPKEEPAVEPEFI